MSINDVLLDLINENKINWEQTLVLLKEIFYYNNGPHPSVENLHRTRSSRNNVELGTINYSEPVYMSGGITNQINSWYSIENLLQQSISSDFSNILSATSY